MAEMVPGRINDRWELTLPDFRAEFHARIPYWEEGRLAHMVDHIKPGMTIFDVGAELGDFTSLYRSWVGDNGTVIPFEPKDAMWPSIRDTWAANFPGTTPAASFVGFASDITKPVPGMNALQWDDHAWPHQASGIMQNDPGFHHLVQEGGYIQQTRLDEFAHMTGVYPDAIVMDIEGAEYNALRGLGLLVEADRRPQVWVSVHQVKFTPGSLASWYGKTLKDIQWLMEELYNYNEGEELPAHGEGESFWYWCP